MRRPSVEPLPTTPAAHGMPGHLIRRLHQLSTQCFANRMRAAGFDVTPVQFAYSYQEQVRVYRERFATDPLDRDQELLQRQAWRSLVDDRLFAQQARRSGR